ncbi:MAG: LIC_10190 family membrane protein [Bacteroidia bacterium]
MLITFFVILILFLITHITGYGLLLFISNNVFKQKDYKPELGLTNIIGLALIALITSILHLFFKINFWAVFWGVAVSLSVSKKLWNDLWNNIKYKKTIVAGLLFAGVVSIVSRPGTGDIGDYHLQAILWAKEFPNIIGLGNFNRPLANNNWWFNVQALFGIKAISLYTLNAVFFISVMLFLLLHNSRHLLVQTIKIPLLLFVAISTKTAFVGSVTPDYIVTLIIFVSIFLFSRFCFEPNKTDAFILIVLSAFAVTIKLNAIMLIPFSLYAFWIYYKNEFWSKCIIQPVIIYALFFIPWLIGNIIVSGWLAYPINIIDLFDVDWKVPEEILAYERFSIKQWGKIPGNDIYETAKLSFFEWFPIWFGNNDLFNKILLTGLPLITVISLFFINKENRKLWLALVLFGISGTLFCFSNGPHIRYAYGYIFMILSGTFAVVYIKFISIKIRDLAVVYVFLCLVPVLIKLYQFQKTGVLAHVLFYPPAYTKSTAQQQKLGNETIYITTQNSNCWDLFPCSYYMVEGCVLRGNDFNNGFKIKKQ